MATEGSRSSSSSVDSYIGSLISLTSKSEIRYEGILYNINTEESSIGLTNVRSFGTEGRKKDGPQLMPSDKVYEYILFRGSDIKDLQVKSSQPVQPAQPINSDPAIIQSHYPRPPAPSSTLPAVSDSSSTPSTYNPNLGQPGSTFQGGLPLYQPGTNIGPWGPPPLLPNANSSGLAMPMYWPGYYAPPNALQQSLPPPPQGLGMPPPMQQYPSFNVTGPPNTSASSASIASNSLLGPTLPSLPAQPASVTATTDVNVTIPPVKPNPLSGPRFPYAFQSTLANTGSSTPSLLTPGQLLQPAPGGVVSAQSPPAVQNEVEPVQVSRVSSAPTEPPVPAPMEPLVPVPTEAQPPILPLPSRAQIAEKPNGATYQNRPNYSYRGRERGRGSGGSRPVMKFTEEFDFNAMNEKFNKDEVWGSLGKNKKDENATDEDESEEENDPNLPKVEVKPVYSKDDFFDSLSSNTSDRQSNYGRTRFSEQMKLDTETFGEFSRYRGGGRGGRGPYRGGRSRGGGYYGRGGGGYGYLGRGRGMRNANAGNDY